MARPVWRAVAIAGAALALLAVSGGVYLWHAYSSTLPPRSGRFDLPGLAAPVTIEWDARGVPSIEAQSLSDALAAEGFVHALDRPLQLELRRRAVRGRLAEMAGDSLLWLDEESLRLGYRRLAVAESERLSPAMRDVSGAYLAGIAAGLRLVHESPPPDCRVAGATLEPWETADILALGRIFAGELSNAASAERDRIEQIETLGLPAATSLWPALTGAALPPIPSGTSDLLMAAASASPEAPSSTPSALRSSSMSSTTTPRAGLLYRDRLSSEASNAWAVSAQRSATQRALMVGDPHLGYELPSIWYEVRLSWPGGSVAGASLVGVPGVIIGHNATLAWSFTAAGFDDADLFLVEVDDAENPTKYREGNLFRDFEIDEQSIPVRDGTPHTLRIARAGTATYVGASPFAGRGYLLRWAALENDGLADSVVALATARDVREGVDAARKMPGPGLNFVAADSRGSIAHALVGRAPQRRGDDWDGLMPLPWQGAQSWNGFVPVEAMPTLIDPPEGIVVSANEPGLAATPRDPSQVALRGDYFENWRADRIRALLNSGTKLDAASMERMLADTYSLLGEQLRQAVATCAPTPNAAARAYLGWNGQISGRGALLHAGLLEALSRRGRDTTKLGKTGLDLASYATTWLNMLAAQEQDAALAPWFDDPATSAVESPCAWLQSALDESYEALGEQRDDAWERHHVLALTSPVGIGPLARWFNAPMLAVPGDRDTVFVTAYRRPREAYRGQLLRAIHGSSYRYVATWDESNNVRSRSIIPGGQAGHPASPHAFDQLAAYARTQLYPLIPAPVREGQSIHLQPPAHAR
ncbi:MAG: penicillin acylase family protein [Acidobacteriota bacterium]